MRQAVENVALTANAGKKESDPICGCVKKAARGYRKFQSLRYNSPGTFKIGVREPVRL